MNYHLYYSGNIGMANAMMSLENGLIMALLKNDRINFIHGGSLFNSEKNKTIFDLYDIDYDIVHNQKIIEKFKLPFDLHNSVIFKENTPNDNFINGRQKIINLNQISEFETYNWNTLGFYSYLFCFSDLEKEIVFKFIKNNIKPKKIYQDIANDIIAKIESFGCINVRRGDYLNIPNNKNSIIRCNDFLDVVKYNIKNNKLLIVSDEKDKNYFDCLNKEYNTLYIQDFIPKYLDSSEKGLVMMIVASYSESFIGTFKSTFSSMIQRLRRFNGFLDEYKFLYPQDDEMILINGFLSKKSGQYSWNKDILPNCYNDMLFWVKEWDECSL